MVPLNRTMDQTIASKIIVLRSSGKTYTEINTLLGIVIPKSTLSYWCNKIPLNKNQVQRIESLRKINLIKARGLALEKIRENRIAMLKKIESDTRSFLYKLRLDKDTFKLALAFLYLGEGAKWKSHRGLQLGSSDHNILLLYMKLLKECYGIDSSSLRCYICYRADQNITALRKFWSLKLNIPLIHFYKSSPDKRTINKPTKNKEYRGVCVLSCAGTKIQQELEIIPKIILEGR